MNIDSLRPHSAIQAVRRLLQFLTRSCEGCEVSDDGAEPPQHHRRLNLFLGQDVLPGWVAARAQASAVRRRHVPGRAEAGRLQPGQDPHGNHHLQRAADLVCP